MRPRVLLVVGIFGLTESLLGVDWDIVLLSMTEKKLDEWVEFKVLFNLNGLSGSFLYGVRITKGDFSLYVKL